MEKILLEVQYLSGVQRVLELKAYPLNVILRTPDGTPNEDFFSISISVEDLLALLQRTRVALEEECRHFDNLVKLRQEAERAKIYLRKEIERGSLNEN
jgi:hypothetical protein